MRPSAPPLGQLLKRYAFLLVLLIASSALYISGALNALNIETLQTHQADLLAWQQAHPILAASGFMALYAASVALSLPIATVLTLLGGFLFGRWLGTLLVVSAATLGAIVVFAAARTSFGSTLKAKAGPWYQRLGKHLTTNATSYLLFARLVPIFPFVVVNIVPGLFNIPVWTFVWTTFVGIIPGSFVYVNVGTSLGRIHQLSDLASPQTLLALSLLGGLTLVPIAYRHFKQKPHGDHR